MGQARDRPPGHWLELLSTFGVLVVAVASLLVSIETMRETRRMVAAASIPYVVYVHGNFDPELQRKRIYLALINKGIGPARIYHVRVRLDGKLMANPDALLKACCGDPDTAAANIYVDSTAGAFLSPRERLVMLALEPGEKDAEMYERLDRQRMAMTIDYCFCSVFDECWHVAGFGRAPTPVRACLGDPAEDFDGTRKS